MKFNHNIDWFAKYSDEEFSVEFDFTNDLTTGDSISTATVVVYDEDKVGLFVIFSAVFLYVNRKNLSKDGPFFLYKTKWGIKLIDYVGNKYKRTLKALSYFSIGIGYILMAGMLYLLIQTVYVYLTSPISKMIKAPPIAPLIPYFPKLFGLQSFFPPFYFIYFIVSILIVATVHEFSHGIFAKRFGVIIIELIYLQYLLFFFECLNFQLFLICYSATALY